MEFVWRALSSPHRRQILDLLRTGPLTTGEISRGLPDLSRFAIMQHLQVLEEARLVISKKEGRARLNFSNPIPIREELGRWLDSHSMTAAETALHLRKYAESKQETFPNMNAVFRTVKLEMEMVIKTTPQAVYQAVTSELDAWWPHRFKADSTIVIDLRPGGSIQEQFADGGGALFGMIVQLEPGRKLVSSAPSAMNQSFYSHNVESFESHEDGTLYKKSLTLFGDVPEPVETMFREGVRMLSEVSLRNYLESGIGYSKEVRA